MNEGDRSRYRDIVINGRFLTQGVTGVQRYAREMVLALDGLLAEGAAEGLHVEILAPACLHEAPPYTSIPVRRGGRLRGHAWEQFELPRLARGRLLLNLCNTGPAAIRRQVVTIHDAAVFARPDAYSLAFRTWYQALLRRLARCALGVITPSEFSRQSIARYCGVDPSAIDVVPHGGEHVLRASCDERIIARQRLDSKPFVLAVSSLSVNKNLAALEAAMARVGIDVDVVIAGGRNAKVYADTARLPASFHCLGYVSDGELRALYEHALCLIFPSLYEGFGFPPLEAMAVGCPVIASRTASLPEVCGEAVCYCDPCAPDELGACIRELATDSGKRAALRAAGQRQAARFRWRTSAQRHLQVMERHVHA